MDRLMQAIQEGQHTFSQLADTFRYCEGLTEYVYQLTVDPDDVMPIACMPRGCTITMWRDEERPADIWAQHGENPEARRVFPGLLSTLPQMVEFIEWINRIHEREERAA